MLTFLIGLTILIAGGAVYGALCDKIMKPSDTPTPALARRDGVDFVPMKTWRNALIELLNIAGTGPILGPIQGILFGPIAFITIPIGCVIGGAFHDYMVGMISVRHGGEQVPGLVNRFLGKGAYHIYQIVVCLLMLLFGVVFIYTPGDLFVTQILGRSASASSLPLWIVYGAIFVYYMIATFFPIDKIIGRIYPVFGAVLLLSAVGIFIGLFTKGYPLAELISGSGAVYPYKDHFIPIFFVTVTCGICSGFHATQATLVSRTVAHERDGRKVFYNMMINEGFIAMTWAAAGMGLVMKGVIDTEMLANAPTQVVGTVAKDMLGPIGGLLAIIGVIVLPITSGDTALRALRLMVADALRLDQSKNKNKLLLAVCIFASAGAVLIWSKTDPAGFGILWRYANWMNVFTLVFVFTMIAAYMKREKMPYFMALVPGTFYAFIVAGYICNAKIGLHLPWPASYAVAGAVAAVVAVLTVRGRKRTD